MNAGDCQVAADLRAPTCCPEALTKGTKVVVTPTRVHPKAEKEGKVTLDQNPALYPSRPARRRKPGAGVYSPGGTLGLPALTLQVIASNSLLKDK